MFLFGFRILSRAQHHNLINQQKNLRRQLHELEVKLKTLTTEKDELAARHQEETSALNQQLEVLRQRITDDMESVIQEFGLSRTQIETLWADRLDLIDLYIDKLYSLAEGFRAHQPGHAKKSWVTFIANRPPKYG